MLCYIRLQGEIKVPVTLEEELSRELPSTVEVYRPIRQRVYAVLFDLHKKLAEHRKTSKSQYLCSDFRPRCFRLLLY